MYIGREIDGQIKFKLLSPNQNTPDIHGQSDRGTQSQFYESVLALNNAISILMCVYLLL